VLRERPLYRRSLFTCIALLTLAAVSSHGTILIQDTFDRSGALDGTTTTIGGLIWSAGASMTTDGSALWLGNAGFIPFTPVSGMVYTLEAVMKYSGVAGEQAWGGFGFATTADPNAQTFTIAGTGAPWMLSHWWGNDLGTFAGPGTENSIPDGGYTYDRLVYNTFSIVLDTTEPMWKASFYINGQATGDSYTYSVNPTITHIGIGNENSIYGNSYHADSITLSAVPEPGAVALFTGGMLLLTLRRRKGLPLLKA
jgi:hypothetical protein